MSAIKWITKGLKNLGMGSVSPPVLLQSRLPNSPLAGTQAAATPVTIPPKPKRPLTAYFRFLNEVRTETAKNNPNLKTTELMKIIGLKWKELDDQTKQKYVLGFKTEMESYNTVMEKYFQSLTPAQIDAQEQGKINKQIKKKKSAKISD